MKDGIYNAKIINVDITYESDRGYHYVGITVDHKSGTQMMCGVMNNLQVGEIAIRVMKAIGVNNFSNLVDKLCRIEIKDQFIVGIGHWYRDEDWFRKSDLQ